MLRYVEKRADLLGSKREGVRDDGRLLKSEIERGMHAERCRAVDDYARTPRRRVIHVRVQIADSQATRRLDRTL